MKTPEPLATITLTRKEWVDVIAPMNKDNFAYNIIRDAVFKEVDSDLDPYDAIAIEFYDCIEVLYAIEAIKKEDRLQTCKALGIDLALW